MYRWRNWSTGTYAFRYSEHTLGHGALQTRDICLNYILHLSPNTLMKLIIKLHLKIITLHTLATLKLSQSIVWIIYRTYIYQWKTQNIKGNLRKSRGHQWKTKKHRSIYKINNKSIQINEKRIKNTKTNQADSNRNQRSFMQI